ncbi:hypothetical protein SARC_10932 [Sphaeroforma arctica JP610]|uniref:Casein kinase II subunit beta n=1 Tax=Sphaeroforma arctica JP610 TaxID=667725 RepID=A0A0L0FII2_9EUKA|nr:hypothetical protein SARC_10932 [Sphaeroforma arctica JP610]KNC76574.1 hypothetical protein SARC_10932 [Sphaeroforma arctica JP610]|eukprot:XP_014150476.1 hypothetical protein SARC_10932 [Sphaeroforma arctica JP610]
MTRSYYVHSALASLQHFLTISTPSTEESSGEEDSWVSWFCSLAGNEFFCHVDEDWMLDRFNLTGINEHVYSYRKALDMILDLEMEGEASEEEIERIEQSAEVLYGLIHARYIVTSAGCAQMAAKFYNKDFGECPRVLCAGQAVLPVGLSNTPWDNTVKLFCPNCQDIYNTKSSRHRHIDGAFFGCTFAHLMLVVQLQWEPSIEPRIYVPKIYGFKIHPSAVKYSQRKAQLSRRKKQNDNTERDRVRQEKMIKDLRTPAEHAAADAQKYQAQ